MASTHPLVAARDRILLEPLADRLGDEEGIAAAQLVHARHEVVGQLLGPAVEPQGHQLAGLALGQWRQLQLDDLLALAERVDQGLELRVAGACRGDDRQPRRGDRAIRAGPPGRVQGRGEVPQQVERALVGPLQILEAHADRLEGRQLDEEGRQGAEDVVGIAAEIDLLVRFAGQVLAQLGRDAKQLATVVVDHGQQPRHGFDGLARGVGGRQVHVGRAPPRGAPAIAGRRSTAG